MLGVVFMLFFMFVLLYIFFGQKYYFFYSITNTLNIYEPYFLDLL